MVFPYSRLPSPLSIVAVFLFGLAPLAQVSERNLANWIRGAGQRSIRGGGQTLRKGLVIAEIALAVILVIGSGLMIRAFWKLQQVNTGFEPSGVVSFSLNLPAVKYKTPERLQFVNALEQKLSQSSRCDRRLRWQVDYLRYAASMLTTRRLKVTSKHPIVRRRTSTTGMSLVTTTSRR